MLILLPPSEGKTAPARGRPLDLDALCFANLSRTRAQVLDALVALCQGKPQSAMKTLGLGPTQCDEIAVNAALRSAPTAAAVSVYTGVLFDALDAASLDSASRRRLQSRTAIASALFGLVKPNDRIPAYRLSGDTTLPKLGGLSTVWRDSVSQEIVESKGVVFDLRSGAYVALGPIPHSLAHRAVSGRVLLERNGKRTVVSHHNKATKGRIVRELMQGDINPRAVNGLVDALHDLGYGVELHEEQRGAPVLDIIVREL